MACKLLAKPLVKKALENVVKEQQDEKRLDRRSVLKKVADNLHRDLYDLCDDDGFAYDNIRKIPRRAHAFIDGIEVYQDFGEDEDGNRVITGQKIKFKLSPSAVVQDMAMKHAGLYAPDKVDVRQATVDLTQFVKPNEAIVDPVDQAILDVENK
jgi:hypothetical protein